MARVKIGKQIRRGGMPKLGQAQLREMSSLVGSGDAVAQQVQSMILNEIKFIKSAPSLSGSEVSVDIVNLDQSLAKYWHNYIQPHINTIDGRADRGWDWRTILLGSNLIGRTLRQQPSGLAIVVNLMPDYPAMIPVAMLHLVDNYPHFKDRKLKSTFLWYLADAPIVVLQQLKDSSTGEHIFSDEKIPKGLGSFALDTSIIHSFRRNNAGRLGLHAAKEGGVRLFDWYLKKGMINLSDSETLPKGLRSFLKGNDGRYFCYNPQEALDVTKQVDKFR